LLPHRILSASLLALATSAHADEATSEAEIVVTASIDRYAPRTLAATRTDTPALELPFSVDTVGAAHAPSERIFADAGIVALRAAGWASQMG